MSAAIGSASQSQELPVIDDGVHRQVSALLGPQKATELLELMYSSVSQISIKTDEEMMAPGGLLLVHRLKSEAGLMGFPALSAACGLVDACSGHGGPSAADIQQLRVAIGAALTARDILRTNPFASVH